MRQMSIDVVLLDNVMPGRNGIEWLAERYRQGSIADTIVVTAYADLDTAIEAMRAAPGTSFSSRCVPTRC